MMNILVGKFVLEANENVPKLCDLENVELKFGKDMFDVLQLGDYINDKALNLIPSISANANSSGVMKKSAFEYIEKRLLDTIEQNLSDLDGIYLHLHGASYVEKIGSGEHHLLREIRKIVGPYLPIAISCDPHGNLTKEYVENATYIRSYRQAPHTDIAETVQKVCKELLNQIRSPKNIKPVYRKLPLILGGEQSVSLDEPVKTINKHLDELEKDEKILSCSWHVGYLRHDCPEAGCGIVVIPSSHEYQNYANQVADELAKYVFDKRHEFHYTGTTASADDALKMALEFEGKPVFITDSGDNVTSGAMGSNTFILHQFLGVKELKKKVLFAAINDANTCHELLKLEVGSETEIDLGINIDELTKPAKLKVRVNYKGNQEGTHMYGEEGDYGPLVTVHVLQTNIDITITDNNHSFVEEHQIAACGVDWDDYDIIVVKQGYIHPEEKAKGKLCVMSLTDGATPQDTRLIKFKRIMRPMYPIDEI